MKRIGVDGHVLTGKYQGSRTYLKNMLEHLGALDQENQYVIYSFDPERTRELLNFSNFEHKILAVRPAIPRLLLYWPYIQLRDRLDFLLTQYVSPFWFRKRQLVVIHDILFETHPQFFERMFVLRNRLFTRLTARRCTAIFTVSRYSKNALIRHYGIAEEKIHLTPNAVAVRTENPGASKEVTALKPYILFVGRLEPRKNVETLVEAFHKLENGKLNLVIVGAADFRYRDILEAIRSGADIHHFVEVGDEQIADFYRNAELFVYPSYAEGFGLPVLEALSYKLSVITSQTTALPEAGGDLADYFDVTERDAANRLAGMIQAKLDNPERLDEKRRVAHLSEFDWRASASTMLAVINR